MPVRVQMVAGATVRWVGWVRIAHGSSVQFMMGRCAMSKGSVTQRQANAIAASISLARPASSGIAQARLSYQLHIDPDCQHLQVILPNLGQIRPNGIFGQLTLFIAQTVAFAIMIQELAPAAHITMAQHASLSNAQRVQMATFAMEREIATKKLDVAIVSMVWWDTRVKRRFVHSMTTIWNAAAKKEVVAIDRMATVCANFIIRNTTVQEAEFEKSRSAKPIELFRCYLHGLVS